VRIAVIDSSPLIFLTHLGLARELLAIFDIVYVPRAVHREVNKKSRFRSHLNRLYRTGRFQRCVAADETNVRLLLDQLDEGEAEALAQATERAAQFFIGDEKRAREIGKNKGLKPVGTVRLLARLHLEGRAAEPDGLVRKLRRERGFRASENVVREATAMAAEPI
jgi:predicted nucleic acid-binding protein